jgi:hypothetical protein
MDATRVVGGEEHVWVALVLDGGPTVAPDPGSDVDGRCARSEDR